jgi:hypothetical protein
MENPIDGTDGKLGRGFMLADKLEEIDIGDGDKPRPTFVNANLDSSFREQLIKLLKEYKDCFAWDYSEMPGLDHSIVEHRLPIKPGYKPYKQPPRKIYKDEILADVKKEVERLIDANFIRPCRYAEWISNIVPVYKKNGKMRVCIDFRDLNRATPWMDIQCLLLTCWLMLLLDIKLLASWMAMQGTIRFLWQWKM